MHVCESQNYNMRLSHCAQIKISSVNDVLRIRATKGPGHWPWKADNLYYIKSRKVTTNCTVSKLLWLIIICESRYTKAKANHYIVFVILLKLFSEADKELGEQCDYRNELTLMYMQNVVTQFSLKLWYKVGIKYMSINYYMQTNRNIKD